MTATVTPATQTSPDNDARAEMTLPIDRHDLRVLCAACREGPGQDPGVASANVNLATEKATVAFDPETSTVDQLRRRSRRRDMASAKMAAVAAPT